MANDDENPSLEGQDSIVPVTASGDNNSNEPPPVIATADEPIPPLIVCTWCSDEKVKNCARCNRTFCTLHASRFSPIFCQECFKGVKVILEKYNRKIEEYDPTTDSVRTKSDSCDTLRLDGPDWVWLSAWIHQLNDEELKVLFDFHYFVIKMIETANEQRIINKKHKLASTPMPAGIIGTTKTTETKTKKVSKQLDMRAQLKKLGLPDAVIEQMIKAAGGTV